MALFQIWNHYHFKKKFFVQRDEVMHLAKLGSKNTYHKCIKELNHWKYLKYLPSHNPFKGSEVIMLKFDTTSGQALGESCISDIQALGSKTKHQKTIANKVKRKTRPKQKDVEDYFVQKKWPSIEGKKFFFHYQSTGWALKGNFPIQDWKALAEKWMLRENEAKPKEVVPQNWDNLKTPKNVNYAEPL